MLLRISDGDPLEIGARVDVVLDEGGLLLAAERVHLRALALIAYAACAEGAPAEVGPWLRRRIADSVGQLLAEDREAERGGDLLDDSCPHFLPMIAAFGVERTLARRASVAFHALPAEQRRLVRGIVQAGRSLAEIAAELHRPVGALRPELRAAVESLERALGMRLAQRPEGGERG